MVDRFAKVSALVETSGTGHLLSKPTTRWAEDPAGPFNRRPLSVPCVDRFPLGGCSSSWFLPRVQSFLRETWRPLAELVDAL